MSGYSKQEISVHRKGLLFLGDAFFFTIDGANPFQALAIDEYVTVVNCETVLSEKAHDFSSASYKLIKVARNTDEICHAAIQVSDIFLLCNNHTLDQGVDGLLATSRWLRQRGKTAIGTHTHSHAELTIAGKQVAVYSFTDIPGRKYRLFPGEKDALKAVSRLKNQFDLLAVGVHWGREYADYPSPRQRQLAQRLIENGADFIIGHHPHVFQGVEFFHGRPVYYSLGNSNFGTWQNRFSPWSYFALVVTCDLSNGTFCFKEHFYRINNQLKLEPLNAEEKQSCRQRFQSISHDRLRQSWIQWGVHTSDVFVRQESDALRRRFRKGAVRGFIVFWYWLSRPMTLFLLFSYVVRKTLSVFRLQKQSSTK